MTDPRKWIAGQREVWFTKAKIRASLGIYGGSEWYCNDCGYSPGVSELPQGKCLNCGKTLTTDADDKTATRIEVETTEYGYKRISYRTAAVGAGGQS
jgi:hypothetical protein